jgi:uncharacterized membrane protein YuzA (DUF378 family)
MKFCIGLAGFFLFIALLATISGDFAAALVTLVLAILLMCGAYAIHRKKQKATQEERERRQSVEKETSPAQQEAEAPVTAQAAGINEREQQQQIDELTRAKSETEAAKPIASAPSSAAPVNEIIMPMSHMGKPIAYHYDSVKIFILSGQEPDFKSLNPGDNVRFVQEPTNSYDKNAVAAESGIRKLGYLYKGKIQDMVNDFINSGDAILSHIDSIDDANGKITVYIAFYRKKSFASAKTYKLTANRNEEMQDVIYYSSEGDEVFAEYDYEKEKHLASTAAGDIGYFPKSANDILEGEYTAQIERIDEDDGKSIVYVAVSANS